MTVWDTRRSPFEIVVALDHNFAASGSLFLDDGGNLDVGSNSLFVTFSCSMNNKVLSVTSSPTTSGTLDPVTAASVVERVSILGISSAPNSVRVNGGTYSGWTFEKGNWVSIQGLNLLVQQQISIELL